MTTRRAALALEDGTVLFGEACGAEGERTGELVFNTSLTGYQEVLTDPSYKGQIVVMTYPHIGNYGVTREDMEAPVPSAEGLVVRECTKVYSNWQAVEGLESFLKRYSLVALSGVDTRRLTVLLREKGALRSVLSTLDMDARRLVKKAKQAPSMTGQDLASRVSCRRSYLYGEGPAASAPHVVAVDYGIKLGILRQLAAIGAKVTVVPASATAEEIQALGPDGVLLSNGPGDPEPVRYAVETIKRLLDTELPIFGICLGHQLLGLALGAKTYKLKFGHRGSNHPVKDLVTGKIEISTHNHGFAVNELTLPRELRPTHVNLNDKTLEGMAHLEKPVFSVQFHPEASAGPHDSRHLFHKFRDLMLKRKDADGTLVGR